MLRSAPPDMCDSCLALNRTEWLRIRVFILESKFPVLDVVRR
jgi:hypothetical protein